MLPNSAWFVAPWLPQAAIYGDHHFLRCLTPPPFSSIDPLFLQVCKGVLDSGGWSLSFTLELSSFLARLGLLYPVNGIIVASYSEVVHSLVSKVMNCSLCWSILHKHYDATVSRYVFWWQSGLGRVQGTKTKN